jgi:hypothetical protein
MVSAVTAPKRSSSNRAFTAIGVFFYFAMTMALYAAITLLRPGTVLDRLWSLNPDAHQQVVMFRKPAGAMFLVVATAAAAGGIGWFRHRMWAWRLAVFGMCTQLLGDFVSLIRGDFLRGGTGVLIAGGLLIYLLSDKIRRNFNPAGQAESSVDQRGVH